VSTFRRSPFRPFPLRVLLGRVAREWETRHRIFDLPSGRFHHVDPVHDLSVELGGRRAATPLGPAAGPHTQLAQNYALAWLAGARVFECKTVQVLDELDIDRPCIDMAGEGYNVEWSQELSLEESLVEYVKAWMLLDVLAAWPELRPLVGGDPGRSVFDLSVGYDLAGIRSAEVDRFICGMLDAGDIVDALREEIPEPFAAMRDLPFEPRLATTSTISTFHGCPPDEIEAITRHLVEAYDLDVVVKLNPTLLGHEAAIGILHGLLGYTDVRLDPSAFEADLAFDRALELIPSLQSHAADRGHRFGIKLSNTLVVENDRGVLPGSQAYLSGAPLHVLTATLLARLHEALPGQLALGPDGGPVQVSWSAGLDAANLPALAGTGAKPLTVCSTLLKPGGYGHLSAMLRKLADEMDAGAVTDLDGWVEHAHLEARAEGHPDAVAAYASWLGGPDGSAPYAVGRTRRRLRSVDRPLERWGCVACNLCVTVCPNDAVLHVRTPAALSSELTDAWQYLILAELCNDCGNCTTFCPEDGAPWAVKPRLFLDQGRFAADSGPAFLLEPADAGWSITPAAGFADDLHRLTVLLEGDEGLPLRPQDLATA
jgi:putative selenate reductase